MSNSNMIKQWNIGWGTVSYCNMSCEFCYSKFKRNEDKDLKYDDWINFVDENHHLINSINYGTGENSLCNDWYRLIDYINIRYPEIKQAVTTNGYISEAISKSKQKYEIVNRCIDEFDISLDFSDEESHNCFRGQSGAYRWALNTLEFCKKNKKVTTIVCLASKVNLSYENINGIFNIARIYDAKLRINLYRPTEGIDDLSKQFIVEPVDLLELLYKINKDHRILSLSDALFSSILTDKLEIDHSGIDSLRILPNGDITPSTYLIKEDFVVGNITTHKVIDKIQSQNILENKIYDCIPEECSGCQYSSNCRGGVYDRRYLWYGTLKRKDPYCLIGEGKTEFEKLVIASEQFESVHYGYLPTMFFLPGKRILEEEVDGI